MPVQGTDLVLGNIVAFGGRFLKTVTKTMEVAGNTLHERVKRNVSLADHSLRDLRLLEHPYAKRHGAEGIPIHDPYWKVHRQSGQMLQALFVEVDDATVVGTSVRATATVGFDEGKAPHAAHVIFGTDKMIPRDPLEGSLREVRPNLEKLIRQNLKNAVVSFKGTGTQQGGVTPSGRIG